MIEALSGDEVSVFDKGGNLIEVETRVDGADLILINDDKEVRLENFLLNGASLPPVIVSPNQDGVFEDTWSADFQRLGSIEAGLSGDDEFTLMRLSQVGYRGFDESGAADALPSATSSALNNSTRNNNSTLDNNPSLPDITNDVQPNGSEPIIEDPNPNLAPDEMVTFENAGVFRNVITNDRDADSPLLTITQINGSNVGANEPVSLANGAIIRVLADGSVFFDPNGKYDLLNDGESATATFTYTAEDSSGNSDTETVTVTINGISNPAQPAGTYQVSFGQLRELIVDPDTEEVLFSNIGDPLGDNYNSIAYNPADGLIYAVGGGSDPTASGIAQFDLLTINPFTGELVEHLGALTNDLGERIGFVTGVIDPSSNIWWVGGPEDSNGNNLYAIDLDTITIIDQRASGTSGTDLGLAADGAIWSVAGNKSFRFDPGTGITSEFFHNALDSGGTPTTIAAGSVFSDVNGNIQLTDNLGRGLYSLDTTTGQLTRIADAPPSSSNDGTGTTELLPSSQPFLFLDRDGSSGSSDPNDAIVFYSGSAPTSISDTDVAIADIDGDLLKSATAFLTNPEFGDTLGFGALPAGITGTLSPNGAIVTLTGVASQDDYEAAIAAITFENTASGVINITPRVIETRITDIDDNESSAARSTVLISDNTSNIPGLPPGVPPVVFDLDGDGVEFVSIENGIQIDVDGDGMKEQTAWAAQDDAVLIFDENGNGAVDGRAEFAFADYSPEAGATDLEGLAAGFDSNQDRRLSADDAQWDKFFLWQDANGDGISQTDEMISLSGFGISTIELESNGEAYQTADGDVHVFGEASAFLTDGSSLSIADASFQFSEILQDADDDIMPSDSCSDDLCLDDISPGASAHAVNTPIETADLAPIMTPLVDDFAEAS